MWGGGRGGVGGGEKFMRPITPNTQVYGELKVHEGERYSHRNSACGLLRRSKHTLQPRLKITLILVKFLPIAKPK